MNPISRFRNGICCFVIFINNPKIIYQIKMIRSPNVNIIVKALDKVSSKMARDFGEIENLQNNNFAASKFANSSYLAVKEKLTKELLDARPDFNIRFLDGEQIIRNSESKYCFIVSPIDGLLNFSRSLNSFSNVVALEEEIDGKKEITTIAISGNANNQICVAHKGSGAFLNNRRIRISEHKPLNSILCAITNRNLFKHKIFDNNQYILQLTNCSSLELVNLASGKLDLIIFDEKDQEMLKIASVLVREAGGLISQKDGILLVGNNKLIK